MAPTLALRDEDEINFPGPEITSIALIVTAVVVCLAIVAFLVAYLFKRSKSTQSYQQASNPSHPMSKLEDTRRRKTLEYKKLEHEDRKQQAIVSESSTTRNTTDRLSRVSEQDEEDIAMAARFEGLRKDWKEWEAQIQQDRSISLDNHPGLNKSFRLSGDLSGSTPLRGPSTPGYSRASYTTENCISPASPIIPEQNKSGVKW